MKKQHLNIIYCLALICLVCILSLALSQITALWQKGGSYSIWNNLYGPICLQIFFAFLVGIAINLPKIRQTTQQKKILPLKRAALIMSAICLALAFAVILFYAVLPSDFMHWLYQNIFAGAFWQITMGFFAGSFFAQALIQD